MTKAEATKAKIIRQAAKLFNQKGYAGSSIADIMQATGLKKGGIYNHFSSKDRLAIEAFDYAYALMSQKIWQAVRTKTNAIERLQAMVSSYLDYIDDPPIAGGCPILNTAIETDDTDSPLRDRALQAMNSWRSLIVRIVEKGIKKGEVRLQIEPDVVATVIISTIEGAIMMSKLERDGVHMVRVVDRLHDYLDSLV
ncbi:TetR/AcrR family transcriptional regulator [Myxosarcina sp. GI1(2024)]